MDDTLPKEKHKRFIQFSGPRSAEMCAEPLPKPKKGAVLVQTVCSAVSAGTELLVYRGELPETMALDASIESLTCLLYTSPSPRDGLLSRMPSSA